jgi:hypothetical protein
MSAFDAASNDRLAAIRRRVRRLVWWSGVCVSLSVLFGGLILAGGIDWLIRLEDVGVRVLLAAVVWTAIAAVIWRTLWKPLWYRLSDDVVADQVDRRYPGLAGRSRSAAEFATSGCDPRWGSSELQTLVIRQSQDDLLRVEPNDVVEPRRLGPQLWTAWLTCLVAGGLLFAYPLEAATAVRRLMWPWGQQLWPQATVLQLCDAAGRPLLWTEDEPLRAVRGEKLSLQVHSLRGPLPGQLWLETRADAVSNPEVSLLKQEVRDQSDGGSTLVGLVELPISHGSLELRVTGGDDRSMPWYRVQMIEPPTLAEFEITVVPPAYADLPTQTLPAGATQIRGLIGSQVTVAARATKALGSAKLAQREIEPIPMTIAADRRSFVGTLSITKPGTTVFWFALVDRQGFREHQPLEFELRGEIDAVPEVTLTQPDADRLVTPTATIPLGFTAHDDRGLTELRLAWQIDESDLMVRQLARSDDRPLQASHDSEWSLTELTLKPGQRLVFRAEALDACDVGEPHVGKSPPRTLLVVSPEEKAADIARRAGELLDDLADAARQQSRLHQQAAELQTQLDTVGTLRPEDRDLLNRVQFDQRRLNAQLTDPQHGLARRARQLRAEFGENDLTDDVAEPQLDGLSAALEELGTATLPQIDQQLTETAKRLDDPQSARSAASEALSVARQGQTEALETLNQRQTELAQWQDERELTDVLQSLLDAQRKLNADTANLGAETVSKAPAELTSQQSADLQKLANRQRQQADRVGQFQQHLRQLADKLADDEPARAEEAAAAAEQLADRQLDTALRQAADDVAANRIGAAGPLQQQAQQALEELQQSLAEQLPDDAERLAQRLEQLESTARQLAEQAEVLRKKSEAESLTNDDRETLRKESEALRREAQQLERQLDRMQIPAAAAAAKRAGQQLRQAEAAANDPDDPEQLRKRIAAAERELEEAERELKQSKQQAQARLMQEERERIATRIEMLKTRQDTVIAETVRLDDQRRESGRLTRGQLRSLQDLAGVERELATLTVELREALKTAIVVHAALGSVVRSFERASERLAERETDAITQQLERDAAARLTRILTAWNRQPEPAGDGGEKADQTPMDDDQPPSSGPPGETISLMVQLALLREMQADCLERTTALEQQRKPDGSLPAEVVALAAELAIEQAELLSLAKQLIALVNPAAAEEAQP